MQPVLSGRKISYATQLHYPSSPRVRYMAPAIMCFGRKPADPKSKKNEDIEKDLRMDRKKAEREVKLLLLGMMHLPEDL